MAATVIYPGAERPVGVATADVAGIVRPDGATTSVSDGAMSVSASVMARIDELERKVAELSGDVVPASYEDGIVHLPGATIEDGVVKVTGEIGQDGILRV